VIVVLFRLPGDIALAWMASLDYNLNFCCGVHTMMQEQATEELRKSKTHGWKLLKM